MTYTEPTATTIDQGGEPNVVVHESTSPLEGLIDRAKIDGGTPFQPVVLKALHDLKQSDRAGYESLRHQLKEAKVRVVSLDEAMEKEFGAEKDPRQNQIQQLLKLAEVATLFHTSDETAYAKFDVNGHQETWAINSKGFKDWLTLQYYRESKGAPNSESMAATVNTLSARAIFDGPEEKVCVRVGAIADKHYIDLCDDDWRVIEIDANGWRVISHSPIHFTRMTGMQPLPVPLPGGHLSLLRQFINVKNEQDFVMVVSWILACLTSKGPYPVLVLSGEQGSSKSTATKILRRLVDPNSVPLRPMPKDEQNLFIGAKNGHLMAYDNLSQISGQQSDALCRLSTGGGFSTRKLYSDDTEMLIEAIRPILLNSIGDVVGRPDLADRSIFVALERISESNRKSEAELWSEVEAVLPRILGALLDAMVIGLGRRSGIKLSKVPRMADFARWATACEVAFWPAGTFMSAYDANRATAVENTIEANSLASAFMAWLAVKGTWSGTATKLLSELDSAAPPDSKRDQLWPRTAKDLSAALRRLAPVLNRAGADLQRYRSGPDGTRVLHITFSPPVGRGEQDSFAASVSSAPSALALIAPTQHKETNRMAPRPYAQN